MCSFGISYVRQLFFRQLAVGREGGGKGGEIDTHGWA